MPTEILLRHCSPTLAGIKVGNLVSYTFDDIINFKNDIDSRNKSLNSKGIFFRILRLSANKALVYVYRKSQLEKVLENTENIKFLKSKGYTTFKIDDCLNILKTHLLKSDFPHEIGVFLGYPLDDIKAFIHHKGQNCKVVGCWKSYTDEENAKKIFAKYKKCTKIYLEKYEQGFEISKLAVSI